MRATFLTVCAALATVTICSVPALAQTPSLSSQIDAVAQAQQAQAARRAERAAEARRRYRIEQERIEARRRAEEAAAAARQRARDAAEAKIAQQNRDFVLEQRKLVIENEELNLKAKGTLVGRENDIINSSLARQKAGTDLVQSRADANRDYAEGTKTLLQDDGTAAINRSMAKPGEKPKTSKNTN